ncbi:hypothetical protein RvY_10389 [Ramazzottius varieornatus]|uniref:Dehydrogenase/reductase SDR family member 1 n=1 Tax=Ramazzottius varieornatus TaxID=947166 RepID=A0A1D1VKC6_RAMVA|nr:hypothetical protein RvY_10389 [Ramazzottius varieornatus]
MALAGKVALVTGATRGIGKGIALQLATAGATVYITGRTLQSREGAPAPGSLNETEKEVENRGGRCIAVACDHSRDSDIDSLFDQINREQNGRLDILVNNAYSAVDAIMQNSGKPFWTLPPTFWDEVNNVGLRNHYICAVKASQMMVARKSGLIVNISSMGGLLYLFTPAYGVGKTACDRMAADCAIELKKQNVAFVSLWPGPVQTELVKKNILEPMRQNQDRAGQSDSNVAEHREQSRTTAVHRMFEQGETPEFAGKCIVALAQDAGLMKKTGRVLTTADLGQEYSLCDVDGRSYSGTRSLKYILQIVGWTKASEYVPSFIAIPKFVYNAYYGRF